MDSNKDILTTAAWFYLKERQQVSSQLAELVFWTLAERGVFEVQIEKSPVKSEGEILYVRPGHHFNIKLSPLEEMYRLPFQTRVAPRLKWKTYTRQVVYILKSRSALEKEFILPELSQKGLLKSSWLDKLLGRKRIIKVEENNPVMEERINTAWRQKGLNLRNMGQIDWDMP